MAGSTSDAAAGPADRFDPARPFLGASVAVFRDGRVMLAARGRAPMEGLYSLPGGGVEPGETLAEAALRELREETGVEAELIGFVAPVEAIERDGQGRVRLHIVIAAHAARWVSGEPQTGPEARDIRWVSEDEIDTLPTTPGLPGLLRRAFALARESGA
ncbi:MAG TPA: NUDIX hydrolase [Microvirga sp.]|jgi:8-oxo-dGTP diphosphatase|nr:NUDIX hydrolase [Microvirga sp.]